MINNAQDPIKVRLIKRLETTFNGSPWYGKSMMVILERHTDPFPEEVLQLLHHMIAWRKFVGDALNGKLEKIELNTPEDWPEIIGEKKEALELLQKSQDFLLSSIAEFNSDAWHSKKPEDKYSFLELCEGVIDHDLYHLGQIALHLKQTKIG